MIREGMLEELDLTNIPNFTHIAEEFQYPEYDPDNRYSVPYTYGMVGVIYNTQMVDEADTGSWSLMWNDKYSGKILQFNNARDAFGTAMYYQKIDVNTKDRTEWETALAYLKTQKPLVQGYVMDEVFNKMKGESAAIAPYYAGDYLTMYDSNDALSFYYPAEGTNVFVDAMCVPKGSRNQAIAEAYINFMLSEEIAVANAEYIGYATPHLEAYALLDEEAQHSVTYPDEEVLAKTEEFIALPDATTTLLDGLWTDILSTGESSPWVTPVFIVMCLALTFAINAFKRQKKKKNNF
jgi:spermidine/putrescine transport system substrate-binding protein